VGEKPWNRTPLAPQRENRRKSPCTLRKPVCSSTASQIRGRNYLNERVFLPNRHAVSQSSGLLAVNQRIETLRGVGLHANVGLEGLSGASHELQVRPGRVRCAGARPARAPGAHHRPRRLVDGGDYRRLSRPVENRGGVRPSQGSVPSGIVATVFTGRTKSSTSTCSSASSVTCSPGWNSAARNGKARLMPAGRACSMRWRWCAASLSRALLPARERCASPRNSKRSIQPWRLSSSRSA